MGEKDEPKFGNLQKGKKEPKMSEEKGRSLEDYDFFQGNHSFSMSGQRWLSTNLPTAHRIPPPGQS